MFAEIINFPGNAPFSDEEITLDNPLRLCYTNWALKCAPYRGVEQLAARRAHNPEVVGSSPASATIKTTAFAVVFLYFLNFLKWNGTYQNLFDTNFDTNAGSIH